MGNNILCGHSLAKSPLYIESVHINIYSLEELCWFLSNNPALAPEVIADEKLSEWLFDECGLDGVKREYDKLEAGDGNISERLMWIFTKSHYFSDGELRALKGKIEALDAMSETERQKKKGDELVKYGKYKRGISCYEKILSADDIKNEPPEFLASVYYNTGVAYVKMFQSGKALEFFYKAYECVKSWDYLMSYLNAAYFDGGQDEMAAEAKRLGVKDTQVSMLLGKIESIKPYEMPKDKDKAIDEWIRAYHISVDQ